MKSIMDINEKEAKQLIEFIIAELEKMGKQGVAAVADSHGELMGFLRMSGAKMHSIHLAMNKAYTSARSHRLTSEIGKNTRDTVKGYDISFFNDPKYTGFGGGVPVFRDNQVIGAVAVSGLSQEEDEELSRKAVIHVFGKSI